MIYSKYKFTDKTEFENLFTKYYGELPDVDIFTINLINFYIIPNASITTGEGEDAVTTPLEGFHVDIVWENEINPAFDPYEVFPKPTGIHTVMGLDYLYEQRYNQMTQPPETE